MLVQGGDKWHGFCIFRDRKGGKMKKQGVFIILCLALCASFGFSSPQEEYYSNSFARLNYVKGDVFIQRPEDMGYEEGTVNLPIVAGDKLGTRDGRAEIHFGGKNFLRIDKDTQVDFVQLPQRGDDTVILHLLSGTVYLRINSLNLEKEYEFHSPDGSFYILEQGLYRFEVLDNRETALYVIEGSVEAAGEGGFEIVRAGERLIAANGLFTLGPEFVYAANEDAFSEWNRGRDAFHSRYVKTRYLPVEMYEYESELDYYGRWVYERPYGYVWIPDVYHYSWRPYYHGRWVWYPVCGWTWCSYEPWGWCVSHYGRWHWSIGLGWYWIPTRTWGPAWVHWYHGVDYIGWSPLSYYNRPVVIVNNQFYGRHYDRYYPAHSRAFTVIRKDQLSARHVSRAALSQSSISRLGKISLSSRQPNVRPSANRIGVKGSAAAKTLSRSNMRPVSKSFSTGKSIRSSVGKGLARPTGESRISSRSGTLNKERSASIQKSVRTTGSARISPRSLPSNNRSSRSAIKTYPSRNSTGLKTNRSYSASSSSPTSRISSQPSRSQRQDSSSRSGIKTYPSQRTSIQSNRVSSISKSRTSTPSSSRSSRSTIKRYSPQSPSSTKSRSSSTARSSYSSALKRYSSQSRSAVSSSPSRRYVSSAPAYRSTQSRSSYSTPSRTSPKIKSSSPRYRSYSPSRVSSSRSSSPSRSIRSTSSSRVSRSSPSRSSASRSIRSTSSSRVSRSSPSRSSVSRSSRSGSSRIKKK